MSSYRAGESTDGGVGGGPRWGWSEPLMPTQDSIIEEIVRKLRIQPDSEIIVIKINKKPPILLALHEFEENCLKKYPQQDTMLWELLSKVLKAVL